MVFDLKSMSRKELEKLASDVEKSLEKHRKKDLKRIRQEMEKLAAAHGVTVEDILGSGATAKATPKKAVKPKSAPKYADPADKSKTWTGKGRQPEWFKSAISAGKTPESMAV
ncbi:histone-like nucleoid-structuring family protein [Octadecabacter arcticus 238]|jgi:DNA-binding protein H-NS|uniref:Histone-like nucleoid-structuring family protein n=1 Tax=Octadecabacter arcticus 238 TaxID=391616 RepID=M9RLI0_9RHOB|nr:H-NS histone family protein [Octadecabacter arcticus]AGI70685.1 histone-like nucleoid-structuring family protein [Octadecabacter arcticus 238]